MSDENERVVVHSCGPSRPGCECKCTPEKRDCGHVFDGPWEEFETGGGAWCGTATCSKCGMSAMSHDMWCGP